PPALYTLSLHDALPISGRGWVRGRGVRLPLVRGAVLPVHRGRGLRGRLGCDLHSLCRLARFRLFLLLWRCLWRFFLWTWTRFLRDRKSTRLNSSHVAIS